MTEIDDQEVDRLIARFRRDGWRVVAYQGTGRHQLPTEPQEQVMHITWRREARS